MLVSGSFPTTSISPQDILPEDNSMSNNLVIADGQLIMYDDDLDPSPIYHKLIRKWEELEKHYFYVVEKVQFIFSTFYTRKVPIVYIKGHWYWLPYSQWNFAKLFQHPYLILPKDKQPIKQNSRDRSAWMCDFVGNYKLLVSRNYNNMKKVLMAYKSNSTHPTNCQECTYGDIPQNQEGHECVQWAMSQDMFKMSDFDMFYEAISDEYQQFKFLNYEHIYHNFQAIDQHCQNLKV